MPRNRKRPEKEVLKKHIEDGMNGIEIGELYGVSRARVYKWLKLYNLELKKRILPVHYNLTGDPMLDALRIEAQYQWRNIHYLADHTGIDYRNVARCFYEREGMSLRNWLKYAKVLGLEDVIDRVRALMEDDDDCDLREPRDNRPKANQDLRGQCKDE